MIIDGKPAPFLKGIERIIFDMDGVITSEEAYWDVAALTAYEVFNSNKYFGRQEIIPDVIQDCTKEIREKVFCNDKFIALVKDRGVNSNWDLGYVVICGALLTSIDQDIKETVRKQIKECLNDKELLPGLFAVLDIKNINYKRLIIILKTLIKPHWICTL